MWQAKPTRASGKLSGAMAIGAITLALFCPARAQETRPAPTADIPEIQAIPGVQAGMTVDQLVQVARDLLDGGQLAEARQLLLAVVDHHRAHLGAMGQLGFTYERLAMQARADTANPAAAREAERLLGLAVDIYLEAAALALKQSQPATAEQMYARVLMHQPGNAKGQLGLARAMVASDRQAQAIDRYQEYLKSPEGRDDAQAWLELGRLHMNAGFWRQALEALYQAQRLNADNPEIDAVLAQTYQKGGRTEEALAAARAATEKDTRSAAHRLVLADVLLASGEAAQASIEARRAVDTIRERLASAEQPAPLLTELDPYYQALEKALRVQVNSDPANASLRVELARTIRDRAEVRRQGDLLRALEVLRGTTGAGKENARLLEAQVEVLAELGQASELAEACGKLLQIDPDNAIARKHMPKDGN